MSGPRRDVRTSSIRVALGATAVVAAMYVVVALAVFAVATNVLVAQLDGRLARDLERSMEMQGPDLPPPDDGFEAPEPDRPFGPPVLVWTVFPDGTVVLEHERAPTFRPAQLDVSSPQTITVGGEEIRVTGATSASQPRDRRPAHRGGHERPSRRSLRRS